jgi:hypothetical protein
MRSASTPCLVIAFMSFGCGASQKWVSDVSAPVYSTTEATVTLPAEDHSGESRHQPWGAVRPRLSEVMTLGETDLPVAESRGDSDGTLPSQPVVVNVNNYAAAPSWPMYGPIWGANSFPPRSIPKQTGLSHTSAPVVGSNWPASSPPGSGAANSPPSPTPSSDAPTKMPAQRVGSTTCAACITTSR